MDSQDSSTDPTGVAPGNTSGSTSGAAPASAPGAAPGDPHGIEPGVAPRRRRWRWALRLAVGAAVATGALVLGGLGWIWVDAHADRRDHLIERVGTVAGVARTDVATDGDYRGEAVRLTSTSGLAVDLRLLRPDPEEGVRRPAAIVLGGHRTGRDAVELVGDPRGVIVAALDYPLEGESRIKGLVPILRALPRIRRALLDTGPAVALAAQWLAEQPDVDPSRIELVGVSLGGVFAPVAAGLEPRIARLWLVHGAATDHREWLDHALREKVAARPLRRATSGLAYLLARGPALRPLDWLAELPPRELVVVAGRADEKLPPAMVRELIERAPGTVRASWTDGGHVDPDEPEIVRELIHTVLSAIDGAPPPLAR